MICLNIILYGFNHITEQRLDGGYLFWEGNLGLNFIPTSHLDTSSWVIWYILNDLSLGDENCLPVGGVAISGFMNVSCDRITLLSFVMTTSISSVVTPGQWNAEWLRWCFLASIPYSPCAPEDQFFSFVRKRRREKQPGMANKAWIGSNVSTCNKIKGIVPLHQSKHLC